MCTFITSAQYCYEEKNVLSSVGRVWHKNLIPGSQGRKHLVIQTDSVLYQCNHGWIRMDERIKQYD